MKLGRVSEFIGFLFWGVTASAGNNLCSDLFSLSATRILPHLEWYEATRVISLKPTKDISKFVSHTGIRVTQRNKNGEPTEVLLRVLSDNSNNKIEVIGDFNKWGVSGTTVLKDEGNGYFSGKIFGIKHGDQFRLRVNGQDLLDPSALAFSTPELNQKLTGQNNSELNSVFWDIDGVGKYEFKNPIVDLRAKPMSISENEIHALVAKYKGGPKNTNETYNFIAGSGLISELKKRGINAIELLPFNAAADGEAWAQRYQVYGLFAIESKYGTPTEFARMMDKFNEAGIAVVMDALFSHYPFKSNEGHRHLNPIGLNNWKKANGQNLYGDRLTEWNTYRYDYENPFVRRFLIDSVLTTIKYYRVSGVRVDNYDGIQYLPGGTLFLKELVKEIRDYAPEIWMNAEMFSAKNEVTKRLDQDGHGMNSYNNGKFFGEVVRAFSQSRTDGLDMNVIKSAIREIWKWNEALRLFYITNHDEAANVAGGATGAYFATLVNGGGWQHVEGKTRVFGSLAMMAGSMYLDMLQLRILQEGNFYSNPNVEWGLLESQSQKNSDRFFADLSKFFISESAFNSLNLHPEIENHVDFNNKIISLERIDFQTGKRVYAVINFNHNGFENYSFGVGKAGNYKIKVDSDRAEYGGSGRMGQSSVVSSQNIPMHGEGQSVKIPYLAPYGVVVIGTH